MIVCFWVATFLLSLCALGFILPRFFSASKDSFKSIFLFFIFLVVSYSFYGYLGNSQYLKDYYAPPERLARSKSGEWRALLAEFKKEEFRLRLRLEENPKDREAEWRLLEVLGIKALQNGDKAQALLYWEEALNKMPSELKSAFRDRIASFIPPSS